MIQFRMYRLTDGGVWHIAGARAVEVYCGREIGKKIDCRNIPIPKGDRFCVNCSAALGNQIQILTRTGRHIWRGLR